MRFSRPVNIQTEGLPHVGWLGRHIKAIDDGRSAVLFEQRGEDFDQRRLARAVGAKQGKNAALLHGEMHAL